jgi:hypothetical protein
MPAEQNLQTTFTEADMHAFEPELKIGLLATINSDGLPHLTLLSSLKASGPDQVIFGQFTEGLSKLNVRQNPRTAWLIMSLDKHLWRGRSTFTHTAAAGQDYDFYNNTPMFRYNAYFGIHTVYYMHLVDFYGRQALPMGNIVTASLQTILVKALHIRRPSHAVLNPWTRRLLAKIGNLKFIAYIRPDGYPEIIPVLQLQPLDRQRVVFAASPYSADLAAIPSGVSVAVFCLSLDMEDVLMRGLYQGIHHIAGIPCGVVDVNWVYNSMPPKPMQIYPELPLQAVEEF